MLDLPFIFGLDDYAAFRDSAEGRLDPTPCKWRRVRPDMNCGQVYAVKCGRQVYDHRMWRKFLEVAR